MNSEDVYDDLDDLDNVELEEVIIPEPETVESIEVASWESEWTPPIDTNNELPKNKRIIIVCHRVVKSVMSLVVTTVNSKYYNCTYCRKIYCQLPEDIYLLLRGHQSDMLYILSDPLEKVLWMKNFNEEDLLTGNIVDIDHLRRFMETADSIGINLTEVEMCPALVGFLTQEMYSRKSYWNKNNIILRNTETSDYHDRSFKDNYDVEELKDRKMFEWLESSSCESVGVEFDELPRNFVINIWLSSSSDVGKDGIFLENALVIIPLLVRLELFEILRYLISIMMISPRFCYSGIKYYSQYRHLFKKDCDNLLWYNMRLLYLVEKIKCAGRKHRPFELLTMDVSDSVLATGLPRPDITEKNPYLPMLISQRLAGKFPSPELPMANSGLVTYEKFESRLQVFTNHMLDGLDWDKTYLFGSAMTACLIDFYCPPFIHFKNADINLAIDTTDFNEYEAIVTKHFSIIQINTAADNTEVAISKIKTKQGFKFSIERGSRVIKFFRLPKMIDTIQTFNLGCTRACYDGHKIYMCPTFICSAYTLTNFDMRWSTSNKDLVASIQKYINRGFLPIMNKECNKSVSYIIYGSLFKGLKWKQIALYGSDDHQFRTTCGAPHLSIE